MKTKNVGAIGVFITILLAGGKEVGALAQAQVPPVLLHSLFNPSTHGQSNVLQGHSVAMDGNFVVVGPQLSLIQVPERWTFSGGAVAVDGSNIVVGAPYDDTNARDRGAAYVFRSIK